MAAKSLLLTSLLLLVAVAVEEIKVALEGAVAVRVVIALAQVLLAVAHLPSLV
jgi:hypothetical protein